MENSTLFNIENVQEQTAHIENKLIAPYVKATYSSLGGLKNVSILITISVEPKSEWSGGILHNSKYAMFHLSNQGVLERFSGNLPKMRKSKVSSIDEAISKINKYIISGEKYEDGGNIEEEEKQIKYKPASSSGFSINTYVPASMYSELNSFYDYLKSIILEEYNMTIEQFVAFKLHYDSVDDLFYSDEMDESGKRKGRFAKEQIDAIATAIFNCERNNQGIIIADQTGVGKGRTAAGLIRYAILEQKKQPLFCTDKKHLIIDIYRDLIDIGFEANVPIAKRKKIVVKKEEYTDKELLSEIMSDLKETDDVRVDYEFPEEDWFSISKLKQYPNVKKFKDEEEFDKYEEEIEKLKELYHQYLVENGKVEYIETPVSQETYNREIEKARQKGKISLKPFCPSMIDIENQNGDLLYRKMKPDEVKKIFGYYQDKSGKLIYDFDNPPSANLLELPTEFSIIAAPYTQIRTEFEKVAGKEYMSPKYRFFMSVLKNNILVLDEAHNAAGGSATFRVMSNLIKNSLMTTFLSATFAKRPDNMPVYAKKTSLSEARLSDRELIQVFKAGETALQEAVSVELVRNGQILRRDKQIVGETKYFYVYDDDTIYDDERLGTQQKTRLDVVASLFKEVMQFQKSVSSAITTYKKSLPSRADNNNILRGSKEEINKARTVKALSFQLFNFFLIGVKFRQTMYEARTKMTNGRKVVFAIANTMESALKNLSKTFLTDKDSDKYKVGDTIENDFKLYLAYMLFYTMRYKLVYEVVSDDGQVVEEEKTVCVFDENHELSDYLRETFFATYVDLLNKILSTRTYISISPIDMLKSEINGFKDSDDYVHSIEEITGRSLYIKFTDDEKQFGVISKRESKPTVEVVKKFNENEIDHLIINQSGAVGISMHPRPVGVSKIYYPTTKEEYIEEGTGAKKTREIGFPTRLENKEEIKKRCMIILQMELDISKEVQKLGRISRTGQVYEPEYTYIISSIPSESRLTAMMERKLRSLSANTSGNQKQSSDLFEQEDFFGEIAVAPFVDTLKSTNMLGLLGIALDRISKEDIKEFTKILYFYPFNEQLDFYQTFSRYLSAEIEKEKLNGNYVGKLGFQDFKAKTVLKLPFFIGNENSQTSFGRHAFIEKVQADVFVPKTNERQVKEAVDEFLKNVGFGYYSESFDSIESYQRDAKYKLDILFEEQVGGLKRDLEEKQSEIDVYELNIQMYNSDIAKISAVLPQISVALVEKELIQNQFNEAKQKFSEALAKEDLEEAAKIKPIKNKLEQDLNAIKEKLSALKIELRNDEFIDPENAENTIEKIERFIKRNQNSIIDNKDKIERIKKEIEEKTTLYEHCKYYINNAGGVLKYNEYEEKEIIEEVEIPNEDGSVSIQSNVSSYEYTPIDTQSSVLLGIYFQNMNLVPSAIILHYITITHLSSTKLPLSQVHPNLSEEMIAKNKKPLHTFSTIINPTYENYWDNEIVRKEKSTIRVDRWILTGSILRAFKAGLDSSYRMSLTKYSTLDRKFKLGCVINNLTPPDMDSTYQGFERQYNADRQYTILFEGSVSNSLQFIFGRLYNYYIECYYNAVRTGDKSTLPDNRYDASEGRQFIQISTSLGASFIVISVSNEIKNTARLLFDSVDNDNLLDENGEEKIPQMSEDEFMSNLEIEIISESVLVTDAFVVGLISKSKYFNYYVKKGSFVTDDFNIATKDNFDLDIDLGNKFINAVLTNDSQIIDLKNKAKGYSSKVTVNRITLPADSFSDFMDCLSYFEEINSLPTFGVGSTYFSNYASNYMFDDVVEKVSTNKDQIPTEGEKEVSVLIDELVNLI